MGREPGTDERVLSNPFEETRRRFLRRKLLVVASFLLALGVAGQLASILGLVGTRAPNLGLLTALRTIGTLLFLVALVATLRDRFRLAITIILVDFLVSLVLFAVISEEPGYIGYLGTVATAVLAIQIATLLVAGVPGRLSYGALVLITTVMIGAWYRTRIPAADQAAMAETIAVSVFILVIVFVPSLVGAAERNRLIRVISDIAFVDSVTGLPNAARLRADLDDIVDTIRDDESRYPVFGISIHGLDKVNRREGYRAGDAVLRQFAENLRALEDRYTLYRTPGAVFVLLPRFAWTPDQSPSVGAEISTVAQRPMIVGERSTVFSVTLVGTIAPIDGRNARRLVQNLQNAAVRRDDTSHAERIRWFDVSAYREMERRFVIEESLHEAVSTGQLTVAIQPKQDLRTGHLHGGEVLARWNHPGLGPISPADFIPAVETEGLMVPFTDRILLRTEEAVAEIPEPLRARLVVAVNLNASSIESPKMLGNIERTAAAIRPAVLEVELTEDVFLLMNDAIVRVLQEMRRLGVRLALDDFGTGFSNFSYLQDLNLDTLKIDGRFVAPLPDDENSLSIVRAITTMAHSFGIEVVAEGVETEAQSTLLRELGCDVIQGYLFDRPLSPSDFAQRVEDHRSREV